MAFYRIGIIGSGNVASRLALALEEAGHFITIVYSRNPEHAEKLAAQLYDTEATSSADLSQANATLFIMAVADSGIADMAASLILPEGSILAHTSGASPMSILNHSPAAKGVFYPLQTFTKGRKINLAEVPFCLEYEDDFVRDVLLDVASSLSSQVYSISSEQRLALHVAAIFVNNFSNHLYALANTILQAEDIQFDLLHALVKETAYKAIALGPDAAQTGPAIRNDYVTLQKHLDYLQANPELSGIYDMLTTSIKRNN